jgi:hypothetical protein
MNALIGWNPRVKDVDSNPTPRALVADSYEHFINQKRQNNIDNLQNLVQPDHTLSESKEKALEESINSICKYQEPYIKKSLYKLLDNSFQSTETICDYIIVQQNEINIKESTKEGKNKVLLNFIKF